MEHVLELPGYDKEAEIPKEKNLPQILRGVSLVILITAAITFLCQGWGYWSSIERVGGFVGFIVALAATGLFLVKRFNDDKGARVAVGVATGIIPAVFCQIGGVFYSLVHPGISVSPLFRYTTDSLAEALIIGGLSTAVLVPIALFGFSILARSERYSLLASFLIGNGLLLIPSRDPIFVGSLGVMLTVVNLLVDLLKFQGKSELKTVEAVSARTITYVPAILCIARNIAVYGLTSFLCSGALGIIAAMLFLYIPTFFTRKETKTLLQDTSLPFAGASWLIFSHEMFRETLKLPLEISTPLLTLPLAVILFGMSFFRYAGGNEYRKAAGLISAIAVSLNLLIAPGFTSSFSCIIWSIMVMVSGFTLKEKTLFKAGGAGLAVGVLYHLRYAVQIYQGLGPWLSLAILGVGVLILAGAIEGESKFLRAQWERFRNVSKDWA